MLNQYSVGTKITFALASLLLIILGLGGTAMNRIGAMQARNQEVGEHWLPSVTALGNFLTGLEQCRVYEARLLMASDAERPRAVEELREKIANVDHARTEYGALIGDEPTEKTLIDSFDRLWAGHRAQALAVLDAPAHASVLFDAANKSAFPLTLKTLQDDIDFNESAAKRAAEAATATYESTHMIVLAVLVAAVLVGLILWRLAMTNLSRPIAELTATTRRLTEGDTSVVIDAADRQDEIGALAKALAVFKESLATAARLKQEQESERVAKEQRVRRLEAAMAGFEQQAGGLVGQIASAATELEATSQSLAGNANRTDQQAGTAGHAAAEASAGVQTVAAAAEQLSASIGEITRQVAQSAKVSQSAVDEARHTDTIVRALAEGASKIGQVVELISTIAGQTNLLALNATIEAARAGDAGKGFAVVASEVKELANQTARATEEISRRINEIQGSTTEAVNAINAIASTIEQVSTIATTIAAAVEEQGAATAEIARNVQKTAEATQTVTTNISGVTQMAGETGAASSQVLTAAGELSRQAEHLSVQVRAFLQEARAA